MEISRCLMLIWGRKHRAGVVILLPGVPRNPRSHPGAPTNVTSIPMINPGLPWSSSYHTHVLSSRMESWGGGAATSGTFPEAAMWHLHFYSLGQNLVT